MKEFKRAFGFAPKHVAYRFRPEVGAVDLKN
jgi:hypothetical protein